MNLLRIYRDSWRRFNIPPTFTLVSSVVFTSSPLVWSVVLTSSPLVSSVNFSLIKIHNSPCSIKLNVQGLGLNGRGFDDNSFQIPFLNGPVGGVLYHSLQPRARSRKFGPGNLQSYWTTETIWKPTVVFDYWNYMETYSRI